MVSDREDRLSFDAFMRRVEKGARVRSQNQLAGVLGIHRSAVTQAKRKDSVPRQWVYRVAEAFDLDAHWLLTGKADPSTGPEDDLIWVPWVEARLSAGGGSFETGAQALAALPFSRPSIHGLGAPASMVAMAVAGDSMEPGIRAGDTVMIDRSQTAVVAGGIFAVGIDDAIMVKRLEKRPGQLVLISDNRAYDTVLIDGGATNVRILGRVVWLQRRI
jgi:phage repressor protein C with HTH and peptisase S24 domain